MPLSVPVSVPASARLCLCLYLRAVLETWNDISQQFATYELELDRITRLATKKDKRLARSLIIG